MAADLERAVSTLYEDESLTDELGDAEASTLLSWASQQINVLADKHSQRANFDAAFQALRAFVKRVNRLAGLGAALDPDAARSTLIKLAEAAAALGYPVPEDRLNAYLSMRDALPPAEAITMLCAWVEPPGTGPAIHDTPTRPVRGPGDALSDLPAPDSFYDAPTRPVHWTGDDAADHPTHPPESDA